MKHSLKDYTTHDLILVHWRDSMARAYGLLNSASIRHLPVVDDQGGIVGIISDRDFYRAMQNDWQEFEIGSIVRNFMSWPVEAIDENHSVADAARMMLDKKISSLIVTRGSKAVGIVTNEDLLRALLVYSEGLLGDLKNEVRSVFANSTIGQIAQRLADAGI